MAQNQNNKSPAELLAEIDALKKQLEHETAKRTEAESMAAAMAEATAFGGSAEEQATGKTVKRSVCSNPWERDEKKQKWVTVDVPTYFYAIELPAGAGTGLLTNGIDYFHGQTYEVDLATLVDLKSRVARTWEHEKSIHGENENAWRKPTNVHLKSKAAMAAGY